MLERICAHKPAALYQECTEIMLSTPAGEVLTKCSACYLRQFFLFIRMSIAVEQFERFVLRFHGFLAVRRIFYPRKHAILCCNSQSILNLRKPLANG